MRKKYYGNGQIKEEQEYKNGIYHGKKKLFHEEGWLISEMNFNTGNADGPYRGYNDDEEIVFETIYENGKIISDKKYWKNIS